MDNIPKEIINKYPEDIYCYVKLYFKINNGNFIHVFNMNEIISGNCKYSYFIFKKLNWFIKNEIHRISFQYNPFKSKFSMNLYKMNIIDKLLHAMITEKNDFIDFDIYPRENINVEIIGAIVYEYLKSSSRNSKIFKLERKKLASDIHRYLKYNTERNLAYKNNDMSMLPLGQEPHCPSTLILDSLIDANPGIPIDELLEYDELIMEMMSQSRRQKEFFSKEKENLENEYYKNKGDSK